MTLVIIALILGLIGAGGTTWAIFRAVEVATRKPIPSAKLPNGLYKVTRTETGAYDLELVEEDKTDGK